MPDVNLDKVALEYAYDSLAEAWRDHPGVGPTFTDVKAAVAEYVKHAPAPKAPEPKKLTFVSCNAREAILEEVHSALKLFDYVRDTMMVSVQGSYKSFNMLLGSHLLNIYYNLQRMLPDYPAAPETCREYMPSKQEAKFMIENLRFVQGAVSDPWLYSDNPVYQQGAVLGLRKATELMLNIVQPKENRS